MIGVALVSAGVGILPVHSAVVEFSVYVKTHHIGEFHRKAIDLGGRGQTVFKGDHIDIGIVFYIVPSLSDQQKYGRTTAVRLAVGSDLYLVIIAQDQVEFDFSDLGFVLGSGEQKIGAVEIVAQLDLFVAVGRDKSLAWKAPFDDRLKTDFLAAFLSASR